MNTETCRRRKLIENFLFSNNESAGQVTKGCHCCDLCAKVCACSECEKYQFD